MADTIARDALVSMALEQLGALEAGQAPSDEDRARIDTYVDPLFGQLRAQSIVDVSDDSAIPIEWSEPLALLLANMNPVPFGKTKMPEQERRLVEQRLRAMTAAQTSGEPLRTVYY